MKTINRIIIVGCILWGISGASVGAQPALTERLKTASEKAGTKERLPVLVYFSDKGILTKEDVNEALKRRRFEITPRAIKRRAKMGREHMTFEDLPVCADYISWIEKTGALSRQRLNWFNAASFMMTPAQIKACQGLSFIKRIDLLPSRRKRAPQEFETAVQKMPEAGSPKAHLLSYGPSFTQDSLINAVVCHDSGYSGQGVLIAMFDTGFRKGHAAFDSIHSAGRLVDEWDFCTNLPLVDSASHGTGTWSEAGGYVPGQLIGPAYKALWAIYHTEDLSQEMPVEEDHWAAALQRADSVGADVVSSSLGYRDFDSTEYSYGYEDLDGKTAISSVAASHAASLGIIVCNSMANSGPSIGSLAAPADADSILSVGATDSFGIIASYSSRGPAYDGRPKPEVCAQGTNIYWANWSTVNSYTHYATGTSCAAPLVAGACALILEAHPDWTPMQVREALMMTASRSATPDSTTYGWGVIDAWAAIHYTPGGISVQGPDHIASQDLKLSCRPNPVRGEAVIEFSITKPGPAQLSVYDITGRLVCLSPAINAVPERNRLSWNGRDNSGRLSGNGVYFFRITSGGKSGTIKAVFIH